MTDPLRRPLTTEEKVLLNQPPKGESATDKVLRAAPPEAVEKIRQRMAQQQAQRQARTTKGARR